MRRIKAVMSSLGNRRLPLGRRGNGNASQDSKQGVADSSSVGSNRDYV